MSDQIPRAIHYAEGEYMLAYGPKDGPQLLVLQPLFEEMNRCRATVAGVCRALAARGVGCWLPDLPGNGESLRALETIGWADWQAAVRSAQETIVRESGRHPSVVAIRGGALLDREVPAPAWRLAPTSGRSLLSDLRRSALASGSDPSHPAGYTLPAALTDSLAAADVDARTDICTVRLTSDDRPANQRIKGMPVWRRPEPVADATMIEAMATDILAWTRP